MRRRGSGTQPPGSEKAVLAGAPRDRYGCRFYSRTGLWSSPDQSDRGVRVWDAATGAPRARFEGDSGVNALAVSPDGALVGGDDHDHGSDLGDRGRAARASRSKAATITSPPSPLTCSGTLLGIASTDKTATIWDVATGVPVTTLAGHGSSVTAVAFSPGRRPRPGRGRDRVAGRNRPDLGRAHRASPCRPWPGTNRGSTRSPTRRPEPLSPPGPADHTARTWDTVTGSAQTTLRGHTGDVTAVAFAPDGSLLATASDDRTARVWDPLNGALLRTLSGHGSWVQGRRVLPRGGLIATASWDQTARIWDAATGACLATLTGHSAAVEAVAFSPSGALLATGSADTTAHVWDAATGAHLITLAGHDYTVRAVAFSPSGALVATASGDATARLWDAASGAQPGYAGPPAVRRVHHAAARRPLQARGRPRRLPVVGGGAAPGSGQPRSAAASLKSADSRRAPRSPWIEPFASPQGWASAPLRAGVRRRPARPSRASSGNPRHLRLADV